MGKGDPINWRKVTHNQSGELTLFDARFYAKYISQGQLSSNILLQPRPKIRSTARAEPADP